jgi:tryptophan-rich sensory protein
MLTILVAAVLTLLLLLVGGLTTQVGGWYEEINKPSWTPPNWLFGPAWTVILALAAWAGVLGWSHAHSTAEHARVIVLFAANGAFHLLWSPLFFNLRRPDLALLEVPFLWLSILALMVGLAPLAPLAVWLLAPYLAWVSFAAVLNAQIVRINPPFKAKTKAGPAPAGS